MPIGLGLGIGISALALSVSGALKVVGWMTSAQRILDSATRGIADIELVRSPAATVTVTGSQISTLSGFNVSGSSTNWTNGVGPTNLAVARVDDETKFRHMGAKWEIGTGNFNGRGMSGNSSGAPRTVSGGGLAFRTSSPAFDFSLNVAGSSPLKYTIYVTENGVRRRATAADSPAIDSTVNNIWIKCDFGSELDRIIEIYTNSGTGNMGLRAISVATGYTITAAPALLNEANIVVVGDSHTDHPIEAGNPNNIKFSRPDFMAQVLGVRAPRCQGIPGSGFINDAGVANIVQRLTLGDIKPTSYGVGQADLVCLMGSSNDNVGLNAAYTDAALKTAVKAAIATAMADQPNAIIAVFGPLANFSPAGGAAEQPASRFTAIAEAVAEAGHPRVIFIDNGPGGPLGRILTSANYAPLMGTGGVHMNRAGVEFVGEWDGQALLAAISDLVAFNTPASSVIIPRATNYAIGDFNAYTSMWGAGSYTAGVDWDASLKVKSSVFPELTEIDWNVPPGVPPQGVWGFLAASGPGNYDGWPTYIKPNTFPAKPLTDIASYTQTIQWGFKGSKDFGVLYEHYLTQDSRFPASGSGSNRTAEIALFLHEQTDVRNYHQGGTLIGSIVIDGITFDCRQHSQYLHLMNAARVDVGRSRPFTMDWRKYWDFLIFHGLISGSEWHNGAGIGVEPQTQSGASRSGTFILKTYKNYVQTYTAGFAGADYLGTNYVANQNDMTLWDLTGLTNGGTAPDWDGGNTSVVLLETNTGGVQGHAYIKNGSFITVDSREMDIVLYEDFVADKGRTAFQMYVANGNFSSQIKTGYDVTQTVNANQTAVDGDLNPGSGLTRVGWDRKLTNFGNNRFRAMQIIRKAAGITQLYFQFGPKNGTGTGTTNTSYIGDTTKGMTVRARHRVVPMSKITFLNAPTAGVTGVAYSYVPLIRGGKSPLSFSASVAFASGWSVNATTGELAHSNPVAGTVTGTIRATAADGVSVDLPVSFSVAAAPLTSWDAANKSANVTLSELNRRMTSSATNSGVRSTSARTSPQIVYAEVELVVSGDSSIGLVNASGNVSGWIAGNANGCGINPFNGNFSINGSSQGSAGTGTFVSGDIIGMEINRSTGKIEFSKNGTWGGVQFNIPAGDVYLAMSANNGFSARIRTESTQCSYAPRSGVSYWN